MSVLYCVAEVRYWENALVNGVRDEKGELIPCKCGELWILEIDPKNGNITNWIQGISASVHYKVCDEFSYQYGEAGDSNVIKRQGYVPRFMFSPKAGRTFDSDYIVMDISPDGFIEGWNFDESMLE